MDGAKERDASSVFARRHVSSSSFDLLPPQRLIMADAKSQLAFRGTPYAS
jgi:hypothetical protein